MGQTLLLPRRVVSLGSSQAEGKLQALWQRGCELLEAAAGGGSPSTKNLSKL